MHLTSLHYFITLLAVVLATCHNQTLLTVVDPGKTLPETLDYCKTWLQTVAGEIDAKSGIPPPLISLQIKDFLNGPGKHTVIITLAKQKVQATVRQVSNSPSFS